MMIFKKAKYYAGLASVLFGVALLLTPSLSGNKALAAQEITEAQENACNVTGIPECSEKGRESGTTETKGHCLQHCDHVRTGLVSEIFLPLPPNDFGGRRFLAAAIPASVFIDTRTRPPNL